MTSGAMDLQAYLVQVLTQFAEEGKSIPEIAAIHQVEQSQIEEAIRAALRVAVNLLARERIIINVPR